jgi:ADP-ribose pyrophosphatase
MLASAVDTAFAPTIRDKTRARLNEASASRAMISSIRYPAPRKTGASARARFPAPTIEMTVFARFPRMCGSIPECFVLAAQHDLLELLYIVFMPKAARSKSKAKKSAAKSKVRLISSRTVYRGPVFWVTTDEVQEPGGIRVRRDIVRHSGSVVVLAVDDLRGTPQVLLERQYRHAADDYLWEIPAGRIDSGEDALAAAQRELLEETGYTANNWRRILRFYASPGFVAEVMNVYLATGLHVGKAQPEEDELIEMRMVALPDAVHMVIDGEIRDAKTICSLLWLDHELSKGEKLSSSIKGRK